MRWSTGADISARIERLWSCGDILSDVITDLDLFPFKIVLTAPTTSELSSKFDEARLWIAQLSALEHVEIEWRELNHRVLGRQRIPRRAWIRTRDSAAALIGKAVDLHKFEQLAQMTREEDPHLLLSLQKRPFDALKLSEEWRKVLAVVRWFRDNPNSGLYLRQIDVPGVHTKFIESHRSVFISLIDSALRRIPSERDSAVSSSFSERYGLKRKPLRIRFRVLDPKPGTLLPDVTLDRGNFARLSLHPARVIITENEINFLSLPEMDDTIAIFGAGYGWDPIAEVDWMDKSRIYYWGDIDTHGFAILDQLRARYPHVISFLMDRSTLLSHEDFWGEEMEPLDRPLTRLTPDESALFEDLRGRRYANRSIRLEQERVGFQKVKEALAQL